MPASSKRGKRWRRAKGARRTFFVQASVCRLRRPITSTYTSLKYTSAMQKSTNIAREDDQIHRWEFRFGAGQFRESL